MGWRIVYIEESEYLSLYLDNIKIKKETQDVIIPISDIHTLIVDNYKAVLSVNLLNKCSSEKVNIILCGVNHLPQTMIYPVSGNNQSPIVLKRQIEWNESIKAILHQKIVKAKILNQIAILKKHQREEATIIKLNNFTEEVQLSDCTNREGLSAKMYFRALFGKDFIRFNEDPINAGLNYGYAILRSQISKVLFSRGLNPSLGIFHKGPENLFNLSDDIIEVFRPIVDEYVYKYITNDTIFGRVHRLNLIKITTNKMMYNNQLHTFLNVISLYVNQIMDAFNIGKLDIEFPGVDMYEG